MVSAPVYLQALIDRARATVHLGFYIHTNQFDKVKQRVKSSHPNANDFNTEMMMAIAKANAIASRFRQDGKLLTAEEFRNQFKDPTAKQDFIKFMSSELELKRPALAHNTHKSHMTVLNKLKEFRKEGIAFNQLTMELLQRFRNDLIEKGSGPATIEKILKIVKQYHKEARSKGITVNKLELKIKSFKTRRNALTEEEVIKMTEYYDKPTTPASHRKVLRYFLFSCYTGVRISDINVLTWCNVQDDLLVYVPVKTKFKNEDVKVPLLEIDKKFLPSYTDSKDKIFDTFADPVTNRILKDIAGELNIFKRITYHTSRHTFGSLMTEGGDPVATQRMMGHSDIRTTMGYVHTNVKQLIDAKKARFEKEVVILKPINK
ncbi:MAG TPA: tyrosine-type recombinase/integrase [Chryseolinea sp.]|nr:tyrosine-type recombinase/integrase [Chryseolinea sp.]